MLRTTSRLLALLASTALPLLAAPWAMAQETTDAPLPPATEESEATDAPAPEPVDVDARTVLATVNGTEITMGLLNHVFQQLPAQYQQYPGEILLPALLDQAINQILLAQAGTDAGLDEAYAVELAAQNATRDAIAGTFVRQVIDEEITEEAIRAEYEKRVADMPEETEVNASHILVETEEEANAVVETLEGGADFAETAKEKSTGPSAPNGGLLGWFGKGQMVGPFEEAVFALEPGQVSAPVQTQFGWHVIRLNETRVKPKPEFAALRDTIAGELSQALVRERIEALREAADITRSAEGVPPESVKDNALLD